MRRAVIVPLLMLFVLHVVVVLAGFVGPYSPERQNRALPFAPPTRLHFFTPSGELRPFVYSYRARPDGTFEENLEKPLALRFLIHGDPYLVAGLWPSRIHLFGVEEPGYVFLMGTDDYGRDQLSRFLSGAQISLLAGPLAACLALSLGAFVGAVSGYYGRLADELLMAGAELFLSLPWLYLLLGVRATLPLDLEPRSAFLMVVAVLGIIGWARPARLVRGVVLSAREKEFVKAAEGFGASDFYIIRRHLLPQASRVLLSQAALLIPQYILAEITMSFLGLGVSEPGASWGLLLSALQQYQNLVSRWWMWLPALLLVPIFLIYYSLAAALGGLEEART